MSEREGYLMCGKCGDPLLNNQLVKDAYQLSNQMDWLKGRMSIIADMLEDRGIDQFFPDEMRKIIKTADKQLKY